MQDLKTALYERHKELGAKIVSFAGYQMPVQYQTGVIGEHMATREKAGLFDVSHMGEIMLSGEKAFDYLQMLLCNDYSGMQNGDCRYSPMLNENGGIIDDLIVYKFNDNKYLLVVNAANKDKDFKWMKEKEFNGVEVLDLSDSYSEIALQGPKAEAIAEKLCGAGKLPQKNYTFYDNVDVSGINCIVSRTGYTGENGFEFYCANNDVVKLWDVILEAGAEYGILPCGLASRDTLRLEAGMPLYGHEMTDSINPLEAGLGFFAKMDKTDFIGKKALVAAGKPKRRRTGIKITGRGIAREGSVVYKDGKEIGYITSGTQLPFLGYAGAMALLDVDSRDEGAKLIVDVRGRSIEAEVVKLPFYKRK